MPTKEALMKLPSVENLRKLTQSLAVLDAIMCPQWEFRYSSFDSKWGEDEMLASMRNGAGDEYFILFNKYGAIIKGFDHESQMNLCDEPEEVWPGVLDQVPNEFQSFLQDAAFPREYTTFCTWHLSKNSKWETGKIEYPNDNEEADGSGWLLTLLNNDPKAYCDWAKDYYEQEIDCELVKKIYQHEQLTEEVVKKLNPECDFNKLKEDIEEINYPIL